MCEVTGGAHAGAVVIHGSSVPGQRRRIWQIDVSMHCSVLGTCLSMNDLYVIARRLRCRLDPAASAYQVHSWFVDYMATSNELSKLVDKTLEKRHEKAAMVVRRARTEEELEARWKEVAAQGQIAGAYWGAMSHPLCSHTLQWRLFGEIHMLSHLVGGSRRADLCRVHELEVTCTALDGKLAQLKHDHRSVVKDRARLETELESRGRELELLNRRLASARDRAAALESRTFASELEARVQELEQRLKDAQGRASAAESVLSETRMLFDEARAAGEHSAEQVRELSAENDALELELATRMVCPVAAEQDPQPESEAGSLCGKRILCVGGRSNLVQYYRALVERRGGEFLHHDGGIEESLDAVTRALTTVDAVFCPVDCVSHAACLKVKKACRHLSKQFIPLRSSGLSSFARGIRALASPELASP